MLCALAMLFLAHAGELGRNAAETLPPRSGFSAAGGSTTFGGSFAIERAAFTGDASRTVSLTLSPDFEVFALRQLSVGVRASYASVAGAGTTSEHVFGGAAVTAWIAPDARHAVVVPRLALVAGLESYKSAVNGASQTVTAPAVGARGGVSVWPADAVGLTIDLDGRVAPFHTSAGQANLTTWTVQFGVIGLFNPRFRRER
jgi:hypothetical protein